jgi:hypothetical protein
MEINAFDLKELKKKMKNNNINHLLEMKSIGYNCLSTHGGITILINSTGEVVFYQYFDEEIKETEIKHYTKGILNDDYDYLNDDELHAGFIIEGFDKPFLLNEFMKKQ